MNGTYCTPKITIGGGLELTESPLEQRLIDFARGSDPTKNHQGPAIMNRKRNKPRWLLMKK